MSLGQHDLKIPRPKILASKPHSQRCPMKSPFRLCLMFSLIVRFTPTFGAGPDTVAPLLQPFVDRHELGGAVTLVADRDRVLSVETVGFTDRSAGKSMQPDNVFWIASQTKPMTAVAVMMLVDEGKISLDDPVEKYLPEFRGQMVIAEKDNDHVLLRKPVHPITIRETLNHMSGLPFHSVVEGPTYDGVPLGTLVRIYATSPLQSEPGTRYQYSTAGINTAGRVMEVVTGMKYEEFMQRRLFDPLGMKDTTFWPDESQLRRLPRSSRPDATKTNLEEFQITQLTHPLSDRSGRHPIPGGGLFSTAQDTARFCRMLLNGGELDGRRYLSAAAFRELTRRQTPASVKDNYGLGMALGADWFGHGGAQATKMEILPDKGLVIVWMVQHAGYPGTGAKAQGVFREWAVGRFGH